MGKQPLNARIPTLNRIIRGWANYHRHVVAVKTFQKLEKWMFKREQRYTQRLHRGKPARWRTERYWGKFNSHRDDRWVFGDKHTANTSGNSAGPTLGDT